MPGESCAMAPAPTPTYNDDVDCYVAREEVAPGQPKPFDWPGDFSQCYDKR